MLRLIGLAVSIGLADSLNPATVGPALYVSSGAHPRVAVTRFTGGVFVVFCVAGAVLPPAAARALLAPVPHPRATVLYGGEAGGGLSSLGASAYLGRDRC